MARGDRAARPAAERVLEKCVDIDGCLIFTGHLNSDGYGQIMTGSRKDGSRKVRTVHIVVWESEHGPVPEGLELDHLCRNRACVKHLEAVTHQVNCLRGDHSHLANARPWQLGRSQRYPVTL